MTSASPSAVINAVVRDKYPAGDWPSQPTSPGRLTVVWSVICFGSILFAQNPAEELAQHLGMESGRSGPRCCQGSMSGPHTAFVFLSFLPPSSPLLLFGFPSVAVSTSFNSFLKLKTTNWIHSEDLIEHPKQTQTQ